MSIEAQRIATFRRTNARWHMVQSESIEKGFCFITTRGWHDGQERVELRVDGEFMSRWDTNDPWTIDIFNRLLSESMQNRVRRPLPR
jgi:hypothetical protein